MRAACYLLQRVPNEPLDLDDSMYKQLTARQAAYVAEYLIDGNAKQAAARAGYSLRSGGAVHALPHVVEAIRRATAQRMTRLNLKQDDVIYELAALALSRVDHYVVDDNGNVQLAEGAPDNAMAAIESIDRRKTVTEDQDGTLTIRYDVKIKLHDKPQQLKLLGKHVGLFTDRLEHSGVNGGPIEHVTRVERVVVDAPKVD